MQGNLSLPELAARYHISDIYGATIAYFSSKECGRHDLRAVTDRICCYELNLIIEGTATVDHWWQKSSVGQELTAPAHALPACLL